MRHRTDVIKQKNIAGIQLTRRLNQTISHRGRRSGNHEAYVKQAIPVEFALLQELGCAFRSLELAAETGAKSGGSPIARRLVMTRVDVQTFGEEITDVLLVIRLGTRISFRHA